MLTEKLRSLLRPMLANRQTRDAIRLIESWKYCDLGVWDVERGGKLIYQALMSGRPQAIGKLGSVELGAMRKYYRLRNHSQREELTALDRQVLYTNAGVFPSDFRTLERFSLLMTQDVLPHLTLIGVWFNLGEASFVKRHATDAARIPIISLDSYMVERNRWTSALKDKNILVVHPFVASVRAQYAHRLQIWNGQEDILPNFNLLEVRAPLSPALTPSLYDDWFSSLESLKQQMSAVDFDIALIGAGAYSLPLAVHARKLGKHGIHLGGGTQIYFGITGKRWDTDPVFSKLINKHWIRPLAEDTPEGHRVIEDGCYW